MFPFVTLDEAYQKFNELLGDIPKSFIERDKEGYPHVVMIQSFLSRTKAGSHTRLKRFAFYRYFVY